MSSVIRGGDNFDTATGGTTSSASKTMTGQTSVDFTVPAGCSRVTVNIAGAAINANHAILVRVGPLSSVQTSGYTASSSHSAGDQASTTGMNIIRTTASDQINGSMTFTRLSGNTWVQQHGCTRNTAGSTACGGGSVTLTGELSTVAVTTQLANVFTSGEASVTYN